MTDSSAPPPNRYPEQLVGVPQHSGPFAPPFIFPSKNQQKLLINAEALAKSTLTNIQVAHNPTPYLNDAMNGFSDPRIQPPSSQNAKPIQLEMPLTGVIQQLTTPQQGLLNEARKGLAEEQIMKAAAVNANLRKNNVLGAEMVLGRHLTIEEISNKTVTPNIRYTQGGQAVPVEFTPFKVVIGEAEKLTPDQVINRKYTLGNWDTKPNVPVPNSFSEDTEGPPDNRRAALQSGYAASGFANDSMASNPDQVLIPEAPMIAPDAPPLTSAIAYQPNTNPLTAALGDLSGALQNLRPAGNRPVAPPAQPDMMAEMRNRLALLRNRMEVDNDLHMADLHDEYNYNNRSGFGGGTISTEHFNQAFDGSDLAVNGAGHVTRTHRPGDMARSAVDLQRAQTESKKEEQRRILNALKHDAVLGGRHVLGAPPEDYLERKAEDTKLIQARSKTRAHVKNVEFHHAPDEFKMSAVDDDGLGDLPPRTTKSLYQIPKYTNGSNDIAIGGMIGKFKVHMKKLHGGVISLSYPNGKKVPGFPNAEIGPELQNQLMAMTSGMAPKRHKLTGGETQFLDNLIKRANAQFGQTGKREKGSRKSVKVVGKQNTSPIRQAQIVLGEMKAGNNSRLLNLKLRSLVAKHGDDLPTDLLVIIHQALLHNRSK